MTEEVRKELLDTIADLARKSHVIRKELSEMIDTKADLARKSHDIQKERLKIQDRTSVIRAKLLIDIATAKDERGKPIYSNQHLREAALTLRLDENEEYQRLRERLWELDDEDQVLAIERDRLLDRRMLLMMEVSLKSLSSSDNA